MSNAKLKPCANCGGVGVLRVDPYRDEPMHYVVCLKCGMRTLDYKSEARAVEVWNWHADNDNKEEAAK